MDVEFLLESHWLRIQDNTGGKYDSGAFQKFCVIERGRTKAVECSFGLF